MKDKIRYDIHVLENRCITSKMTIDNILTDIKEYADLYCLSITDSFEDLIHDYDINSYEYEQIKNKLDTIY